MSNAVGRNGKWWALVAYLLLVGLTVYWMLSRGAGWGLGAGAQEPQRIAARELEAGHLLGAGDVTFAGDPMQAFAGRYLTRKLARGEAVTVADTAAEHRPADPAGRFRTRVPLPPDWHGRGINAGRSVGICQGTQQIIAAVNVVLVRCDGSAACGALIDLSPTQAAALAAALATQPAPETCP